MIGMRVFSWVCAIAAASACGAQSAASPEPASSSGGEAREVSSDADAELSTMSVPEPVSVEEPRPGDVIEGGTIARDDLRAVLEAGIPRFLQSVRTEPHKEGDRFVGWRLLSIFDDSSFTSGPLRVGDTVLGVNGRTIERPEQLFAVWEALASAPAITFQLLRAGQAYEVRYAIED